MMHTRAGERSGRSGYLSHAIQILLRYISIDLSGQPLELMALISREIVEAHYDIWTCSRDDDCLL
jgi:hypothetical protein